MIDTHVHVWDETCRFAEGTGYLPARAAAPYEELRALWERHGVAGGVLVQPSFLGTDNSYLLHCLAGDPARLRGVIIADPALHASGMGPLHAAGVRGLRFNLISGGPLPDFRSEGWPGLLAEAQRLGWHIVVAGSASSLAHLLPVLLRTGLPLVIDHYGLPGGEDDPDWTALCRAAQEFPIWLKLSAAYRVAGGGDRDRLIAALLRTPGPERLIWGSDWPWTRHEEGRSYAVEQATVQAAALAEACRSNAATLYGMTP